MTAPITTTLSAIWQHEPCADGWEHLLTHLGKTGPDDEPLALTTILDSNGIDDALWALRAVSGHDATMRKYAVWCARQAQHLMTDPRSIAALDVAERYADGRASEQGLVAARAAAVAAWATAYAVAYAASAAGGAAARGMAWAARAAARAAAEAVDYEAVATDAAWAAGAAARTAQSVEFRRVFGGGA